MTSILKATGLLALCVFAYAPVWAQMPTDAIYMDKKSVCFAGIYGQSNWDRYWENQLRRENFNIGTHTTQSVQVMIAYGISKRVNLIASVPYVWTSTSAGNLMGQRGFQDVSGWLKVNAFQYRHVSLHGIVGASIPLSNYVPNFLPMSIGLGARAATGRLLVNYRNPNTGLYATASGAYTLRSNIMIDQDAYQAFDRVYNTREVFMPNATDMAIRVGYYRKGIQAEAFAERFACTSGDNIRRNDMPFPTNNMRATTVGVYGKYQPRNVGLNARLGYVVEGLNMGQSTSLMLGLLYQLNMAKTHR
jgi:hypothetical protein